MFSNNLWEFLYNCRTYVYGNRRYGYYQPNGYGDQYPGQYQPEQFPGNTGLGDDRFKFDPVSKFSITTINFSWTKWRWD